MNRPASKEDCEGKARFSSYAKAERSAGRIAKREEVPMHVYACQQCGGFHVGSMMASNGGKS
jgi:hypothetical protein